MAPKPSRSRDVNLLTRPYAPPSDVKQASGAPGNPAMIKLNPNNPIALLSGSQGSNTLIGRIRKFLKNSPLGPCFVAAPGKIYHDYLCEFWFTAKLSKECTAIFFTLKDGSVDCTLNADILREALNLNYWRTGETPVVLPRNINFRQALLEMGHTECLDDDGALKTKGAMTMKGLTPSWRYFFVHLVESLGGSSGGLDQINSHQAEMAYCLWNGLRVDFAEILFRSLVTKLKGSRGTCIPFSRFLSMSFKLLLGPEAYKQTRSSYSIPETLRNLDSLKSIPGEVEMSPRMLLAFSKTGAPIPGEPARQLGGLQNNEGPTSSSSDEVIVVETEQRSNPVSPSGSVPTSPISEDLPIDLHEFPKAQRTRRLRKSSVRATEVRYQTSTSDSSKQGSEEGQMGTPQAATLNFSLGESGEDETGLPQPRIESVSAQGVIGQTTYTPIARTDEVSGQSQPEMEVPHSSADEVVIADRAIVTEATPVTSIAGPDTLVSDPQTDATFQETEEGHLESDPAGQPSQIFMNLDMNVDEFQLESSDSDETFTDLEAVDTSVQVQHPSPSGPPPELQDNAPTTLPQNFPSTSTFTPTPLVTPEHSQHDQHIDTSTPSFSTPPVFSSASGVPTDEVHLNIPPPVATMAPAAGPVTPSPPSLDSQFVSFQADIQNLLTKVADIQRTIDKNTKSFSRYHKELLQNTKVVDLGLNKVCGTEDLVVQKLDELVVGCNNLATTLKEAFDLTQLKVTSSISSLLGTTVRNSEAELQKIERQVKSLVDRPGLDVTELGQQLGTSVGQIIKDTLAERENAFLERVISEITRLAPSVDLGPLQSQVDLMKGSLDTLAAKVDDHSKALSDLTTEVGKLGKKDEDEASEPAATGLSPDELALILDIKTGQDNLTANIQTQSSETNHLWRTMRMICTTFKECKDLQSWQPLGRLPSEKRDFDAIREALDLAKGERASVLAPKADLARKEVGASGAGTDASSPVIEQFEDAPVVSKVDKGKGKMSESAQPATDKSIQISDSESKKLARLGNAIKERKKMAVMNQALLREHLAKTKLLDSNDAQLLGISLEEYNKIKQDVRIVGMVQEMCEIELDKHYPDDEADFDAKSLGIPVEKARENRSSGIQRRIENVKKVVKRVLNPPRSRGRPQQVSRDANLRTWVEKNEPTNEDIKAAVQELSVNQIHLTNESDARDYLTNVMQTRYNPGKITEVKVTIKPGNKFFTVGVQYLNGVFCTTDNPDVYRYGHSEHVEMLAILQARQQSKAEKGWVYVLQNLIKLKESIEAKLSFDPTDDLPISSAVKRRRTGEGPSV